jgi:lysylphosphatidylglycerol synthetase-like protein (DUF2156 family)
MTSLESTAQAAVKPVPERLDAFLRQHGRHPFAYATTQDGLEQFVTDEGYVAFVTVRHPLLARSGKTIAFGDPVCGRKDYERVLSRFLALHPRSAFVVSSQECAAVLRQMRFKANCIGFESEIPLQTYNTKGDWKNLDVIRRARNEAKKQGVTIKEERVETVDPRQLARVSEEWLSGKKHSENEIWLYARRPVFVPEQDVRKFFAYDSDGTMIGFAFYDPMYTDGKVVGYSANINRTEERRFKKLSVAVNMAAADVFRDEGKEALNLCIGPFDRLEEGWNDDARLEWYVRASYSYGDAIYNFKGLCQYKAGYKAPSRPTYLISNGAMPVNDLYLAFLAGEMVGGYLDSSIKLLKGMAKEHGYCGALGRMFQGLVMGRRQS